MPSLLDKRIFKKKVVLLGDPAVGKTSLVRRFVKDRYEDKYISTLGAKVSKKSIQLSPSEGESKIILMIWDIIGTQGYTETQSRYISKADSVLLVHDLTRPETLDGLMEYWIPLMEKVRAEPPVPIFVVGNKSDLLEDDDMPSEDQVISRLCDSDYSGELVKNRYARQLKWFHSSAKTGENVEDCFKTMALKLYRAHSTKEGSKKWVKDKVTGKTVEPKTRYDPSMSLLDSIIAELPELGPPEIATFILQNCISKNKLDKDAPTVEGLRKTIHCVTEKAVEMEFNYLRVDKLKRKWLFTLSQIEERISTEDKA